MKTMTGIKLINELDKLVGGKITLLMNDVLCNGELQVSQHDNTSKKYNLDKVTFVIFPSNNYSYDLTDSENTKIVYISKV